MLVFLVLLVLFILLVLLAFVLLAFVFVLILLLFFILSAAILQGLVHLRRLASPVASRLAPCPRLAPRSRAALLGPWTLSSCSRFTSNSGSSAGSSAGGSAGSSVASGHSRDRVPVLAEPAPLRRRRHGGGSVCRRPSTASSAVGVQGQGRQRHCCGLLRRRGLPGACSCRHPRHRCRSSSTLGAPEHTRMHLVAAVRTG
mmetsp:Transcript_35102/g.111819  ORF Transcript_35102/g.111819 Transcript_35102/m.111819 type:complete len:200 (-) Transcript_35102:17-616(-)